MLPSGSILLRIDYQFRAARGIEVDKSFTPRKNADNNDHRKNGYCDQVALYIHIVKQCVDFFHNLKFRFQIRFTTRFSKGGRINTYEVLSKGVRS